MSFMELREVFGVQMRQSLTEMFGSSTGWIWEMDWRIDYSEMYFFLRRENEVVGQQTVMPDEHLNTVEDPEGLVRSIAHNLVEAHNPGQ